MESMASPPQIDTDALHATRFGRFIDAALVGASVAVPDYVPKGRGRRMLAQTVLAAVSAGVANLRHRTSSVPSPERKSFAELTRDMSKDEKRSVWTFLGVGTGVGLLGSWVLARGTQKLADVLRGRGVKYPFTLFGAVAATGMFALLESEQRQNATATTKESSDD